MFSLLEEDNQLQESTLNITFKNEFDLDEIKIESGQKSFGTLEMDCTDAIEDLCIYDIGDNKFVNNIVKLEEKYFENPLTVPEPMEEIDFDCGSETFTETPNVRMMENTVAVPPVPCVNHNMIMAMICQMKMDRIKNSIGVDLLKSNPDLLNDSPCINNEFQRKTSNNRPFFSLGIRPSRFPKTGFATTLPTALSTGPYKYTLRVITTCDSQELRIEISNKKAHVEVFKDARVKSTDTKYVHEIEIRLSFLEKYTYDRDCTLKFYDEKGVFLYETNTFSLFSRKKCVERKFFEKQITYEEEEKELQRIKLFAKRKRKFVGQENVNKKRKINNIVK